MAALPKSPLRDSAFEVDKLTNEIFSILENKFLFGYDSPNFAAPKTHQPGKLAAGKVRILSIDGGGATDGVLAAKSLVHLEASLRLRSGDPNARIADFFDVAAGSGSGGILAALLFTRRKDAGEGGPPTIAAEEALRFLARCRKASRGRRMFRRRWPGGGAEKKLLRRAFADELTMRDTVKPVLIPCYDLESRAPFVFSRADALEMDGYDFKLRDVCAATVAERPMELRSVDGRTRIVGVDGRVAMNNPTAAAITHVLNNKQEFPFCNGLEDLLVLSLGNGGSDFEDPGRSGLARITEDGASAMVDQAVSMAFGESGKHNYVRIQANGFAGARQGLAKHKKKTRDILESAEEMLAQKHVDSVLFQGKKMGERTNIDRLELFSGEILKEEERRKTSILPTVVLKRSSPHSTRTSSATSLSVSSSV
ncbi:patatin-like protein 7 [Rhodamnia argentea]|uniref:Patatin n=1 Tax=Rhodamnia argentea TaxID=178133 RepID=A0A8B8N1W9_9MYRT|nr:patatin-like protein 7 [Rhodamnia argentea]XP_048141732.1 patatin-like protein 7 [Rhodamnia argentea]